MCVCVCVCVKSSFPKKDVMFIGAFPWELYALSTNDVCTVNVQMCVCEGGGGGGQTFQDLCVRACAYVCVLPP